MNAAGERGNFPQGAAIGGIFFELMEPTFKAPGDIMPKQGLF